MLLTDLLDLEGDQLVVTLTMLGIFLTVLLIKRKKNPNPEAAESTDADKDDGGGHA